MKQIEKRSLDATLRQAMLSALAIILFLTQPARAIQLSDSSQISLLTVAPGSELYSAFGHSGIRIHDFKQDIDVVFNYGTFDFNQPNFYVNFVRGRLLYMLDVGSFSDFMQMYEYEERSVTEDVLNLTNEEKQHIFFFLVDNAKPANRNYRYEFFFDNCATRIRDVFEQELKQKIHFNYAGFDSTKSLRQMLDLYVSNSPWVQLGFYLILGLPCDVNATPRIQAFLPDFLQKTFKQAVLNNGSNSSPLVRQSHVLLQYPPAAAPDSLFTPVFCILLLLTTAIVLSAIEYRLKKSATIFDFLLFFSAGLLGVFFLCMWAFTEHYSVPKNLNVLWAMPLFLPLSFLLFSKKMATFNTKWLHISAVWLLGLLILHFVLPQPFHIAVILLIVVLAYRAWFSAYLLQKKISNETT